ncbi:MAG: VOC family protein [bacterium]
MEFSRTGIILCTENYGDCVSFYSETLELPIMFSLNDEQSQLTCCDMGGGNYLMIEKGGIAAPGKKSLEQNPVWLRFNVSDVEDIAKQLTKKNVNVNIRRELWGTVADFVDPDGNVCSLRDEASFGQ